MKPSSALLILLLPAIANAAAITAFLGLGLSIGSTEMRNESSLQSSKFSGQSYLGAGGVEVPFGLTTGLRLSGEAGKFSSTNSYSNSTYLEVGALTYFAAKAGFYFDRFAIGGGFRKNEATIKSLSTAGTGYLESNYSGGTSLGFASYNLDFERKFRATIEVQYVTGTLKSSSPTVSDVKYNELSAGLRFFLLFN